MRFLKKRNELHIFDSIFRTLKWTLSVLKQYRVRVCVYIVILMVQAAFNIYIASKIGNIVDFALSDNISELISTGLFFITLYLINIAISIISNRYAAFNYNGMYNSLELKVYRKIMDSSWEELTEYHSGDLITRLSMDIKVVAGNTSGLVPTLVAKTTMIVCAGLYIISLDYTTILVAIVVAPIVLVASRIFMGKILESQNRIKEMESKINSYNKETFNNIQAVKAFGLGDYFYEKMNALEVERKNNDLASNKYSLCSWGISYTAGLFGACICIVWMFYRVHTGVLSFGSLSVLAYLAMEVAGAVKTVVNLIPTIMEYVSSSDRVKKILSLNDESEIPVSEESLEFMREANNNGVSINIDGMYFKYKNGYSVFEGVSLNACPGEIIALVGPSGEGKTTMLRIILGIVTAYAGRVYASAGANEMNMGKQTRPLISYVPQGNTMMEGTILENMRMISPSATDEKIEEALTTACIFDFIKQLPDGINHKLGENGLGFSEGQNQRLSIARALVKDAPILLLDEATSALDVALERRILDNIIKKDPKKTIILTTHRPTVLSMCDRVYRISNKKIGILDEEGIRRLMDEF